MKNRYLTMVLGLFVISSILAGINLLAPQSDSHAGNLAHPPINNEAEKSQVFPDDAETQSFSEFLVVRAYFHNRQMVNSLASWLEPWEVNHPAGYLVVGVTPTQYALLEGAGFQLEIDQRLTQKIHQLNIQFSEQTQEGIPNYECYRSLEETYATAKAIAETYPQLANWIDIGNSWEKLNSVGEEGFDLMALRLTNKQVPGPKPALFAIASLHAREYTPAELLTRFAEHLVENYSHQADITWILDHHEIHLLLQANPDGLVQAETGLSWRKNTNQNYCSPYSIARGTDLNRNFDFQWNCCGGSSSS